MKLGYRDGFFNFLNMLGLLGDLIRAEGRLAQHTFARSVFQAKALPIADSAREAVRHYGRVAL